MTLLAHPYGTHYHIVRSCKAIKDDADEPGYVEIEINEAWTRHLEKCPICVPR